VQIIENPAYTDLTITSNNSIQVEKNEQVVFPDEFFEFVSFDSNFIPTFDFSEEDSNKSVVKWSPPQIKLLTNEVYKFNITFFDSVNNIEDEIEVTFFQDVHWDFSSSLNKFRNFVQESRF
jgi:hypothetical protein